MKQKVLAIAGCIAATAPSATIADVLPENFVGLNLGEIRSSSFINQPFKGVIPFLFSSYENTKNLSINLAPQSIFNKIGAERHPILNNLNFQVTQQNNKPVILISSDKPINLPFLNFILEIKGSGTVVYQDYTVLLDPTIKQPSIASSTNYINVNKESEIDSLYKKYKEAVTNKNTDIERSLRESGSLLLASLSTEISTKSQNRKYTVQSGDSLSKIALKQNFKNASLKSVSKLIYQKNPKAFIRGNVDRLKKGAILNLPTDAEVRGFEIAQSKPLDSKASKQLSKSKKTNSATTKIEKTYVNNNVYTVLKGDSLSKITKKFIAKDVSFTQLMNTIYSNNPDAFINKSKNRLKAGAILEIPSIAEFKNQPAQVITKNETLESKPSTSSAKETKNNAVKLADNKQTNPIAKLKPNQIRISSADTLSSLTNKVGYKEIPFATMLMEIYNNNPHAFKDGKMTSLISGAIITIPSKALIFKNNPNINKLVIKTPDKKNTTIKITTPINNNVVKTDLTKRIRELRKELRQAKENLTELKNNLSNKEILLEQKNTQLNSLNKILTKYDKAISSDTLAAIAIKTKTDQLLIEDKEYKPKSKAEMAKLKRDLLNRSEKTQKQILKLEELKNKVSESNPSLINKNNDGLFKDYKVSSILNSSNTKYAYLVLALLLGMVLIRYRKALYSYTYSKIDNDDTKYFPVPDVDKYDLKEKNIIFHDPKMDEDLSSHQLNTEKEESSVAISPHLIDATEDIFETSEEAQQIAHCEHLVTELFEDLDNRDDAEKNSEWNDIEKFCDTYIEKIKDEKVIKDTKYDTNGAVVEEATDFNDMMTDLLESLEKVDKSMRKNNLIEDDVPNILDKSSVDHTSNNRPHI